MYEDVHHSLLLLASMNAVGRFYVILSEGIKENIHEIFTKRPSVPYKSSTALIIIKFTIKTTINLYGIE